MEKTLIIQNAAIITMNEEREVLQNASIAIAGSRIAAVGENDAVRKQFPDAEIVDGRGKAVLPGLINCHTHVSLSLQKGITQAVPEGLYKVMWPVEKALTPEDIYTGALIGGAEALLGGSTSVVDHYFKMDRVAEATTKLGLRGFLGHTIMSRLGPFTGEKEFQAGLEFVTNWKNRHPLVQPMLAPHASDTVSTAWLKELRAEATRQDVKLHLHLAQSAREQAYIHEQHGMGCVEYLADIGFLGPDVLAAHCIFIEDGELDILAQTGTHPVYCPMGHSLGGRIMRAWEMYEKGAGVLIGTDCVTSNNVMDLTGELRIAGGAQRQLLMTKEAMPSMKILEMVTVDAAEAVGMGRELGALIPGYLADVIMVDMSGLHAAPNYSVVDNLIYTCNGRDVEMVIVNGETVVRNGTLLTADEAELAAEAEKTGRAMIKRAVENDPELDWLWKQ